MTDTTKRDWKDIVKKSEGSMFFAPEKFLEKIKEWHTRRSEFNKRINEIAKGEVEISVMLQNIMLDLRTYLSENGQNEIWSKDLGFESTALKDGEFILSISEPGPGGR